MRPKRNPIGILVVSINEGGDVLDDDQLVNWSILPVVMQSPGGARIAGHGVLGTAFIVELDHHKQFALTARHVMEALPDGMVAALLLSQGTGFRPLFVEAWEPHPNEDIAILQIANRRAPGTTRLIPAAERFPIGHDYAILGYPDDDYYREDGSGVVLELTYSAGHVRRQRGPAAMPGIRGLTFLELSGAAGAGCSGAPLLARNPLDGAADGRLSVSGVYVGERVSRRGEDPPLTFGYALPFSEIADWQPALLHGVALFRWA